MIAFDIISDPPHQIFNSIGKVCGIRNLRARLKIPEKLKYIESLGYWGCCLVLLMLQLQRRFFLEKFCNVCL